MAGHDNFDIHLEEAVRYFNPVADMSLKRQRCHIVECQVSSEQDFVFGEIDKGVTKRMGGA